MRIRTVSLSIVFAVSLSIPLSAGSDSFTLGRYVPDDMNMFSNGKYTKERAQIFESCWNAFVKLADSGIGKDIIDLATFKLPPRQRQKVKRTVHEVWRLITTPRWKKLCEREVAFAMKLTTPVPEYLMIFKVKKGTARKRLSEFATLFRGIKKNVPNAVISDERREGVKVLQLSFGVPFFVLSVAAGDGVVIITTNERVLNLSLGLLHKNDGKGSIVQTKKFKEAFKSLPEAEDGMTYLDITAYLQFYRGILGMIQLKAGHSPEAKSLFIVLNSFLNEISYVSSLGSVEYTRNDKLFVKSRVSFIQKEGPGLIEELIRDQKSIKHFQDIVPEDAVCAFSSSAVDPLKLYNAIINTIKKTPRGGHVLEIWEQIQRKIGFNLRKDLYSWVEGGFGWIVLPKKTNGCEFIFFMRVKDDEKAKSLIKPLLKRAQKYLASRGQKLTFVPLEDGVMKEIRIESMPFCHPVIGFPRGYLVIGSSPDAVERIVSTFRQETPSIRSNPAVAALEVPEDNVKEFHYHNIKGALRGISNIVGAAGFIASIVPKKHDTEPVLKLGAILTKLSAFLREIDLGLAIASCQSYDPEEHAIFIRQVTQLLKRAKM